MKVSRPLSALVFLLLLHSPGRLHAIDTSDPSCSIPPDDAWMLSATGDQTYLDMWMNSTAVFDELFAGLEAEADDWDDGWGWSDRFNLDRMLPRLINGAQLVWLVQQYTKHPGFGLWREVKDVPANLPLQGRWWDFLTDYADDEWEPGCDRPTANAVHFLVPFDEWNSLQIGGAYRASVISRASSMVHEIVHQDVGHLFLESNCNPPSASCDNKYGEFNANTLHIDFLHDAMVTYQTMRVDGETVRRVAFSSVDGECRWMPTFSDNEIASAGTRATQVAIRFHEDAYSGWRTALTAEVANRQAEGIWECQTCDPEDWTFESATCVQTACNESLNSGNVLLNAINKSACFAYNSAIAVSTGPESVAAAKHLQTQQTKPCLPASEAGARLYCDAQKASADHVEKLDACGWLDPVNFPTISKIGCVKEYCHEEYQGPGAVPGDPYGCLDYLCGDSSACSSGEDFSACSNWFKIVKGDPDFYVDGCEWNRCKESKVQCLREAHAAGTWAYGDPVPAHCSLTEQHCNLVSRLALEAFINLNPFLERHPMREVFEGVANFNPGKNVFQFAEQIRLAGRDSATLDAMAVNLTSSPEMIAALFHAAPAEFVGLYGKEGFETILGPKLESVAGRALNPDELTPAGREALSELQQQLELVGGSFKGAIGTLSYSR